MSDRRPLATIDCPECSAWVEIHRRGSPQYPLRGWREADEQLCKAPPLRRCPYLHVTIGSQFPGYSCAAAERQNCLPFIVELFVLDCELTEQFRKILAWMQARGFGPTALRYVQQSKGILIRIAVSSGAQAAAVAEKFGGRVLVD